jgi:hypothetical protein
MNTLFFLAVWQFSSLVFAEPYAPQKIKLSASVENHIKQNTFMIVPINIYAAQYSKSEAEDFVRLNCQNKNLPPNEILNCNALKSCEGQNCVREYEPHGTGFLMARSLPKPSFCNNFFSKETNTT